MLTYKTFKAMDAALNLDDNHQITLCSDNTWVKEMIGVNTIVGSFTVDENNTLTFLHSEVPVWTGIKKEKLLSVTHIKNGNTELFYLAEDGKCEEDEEEYDDDENYDNCIENNAFHGCSSLTSIKFRGTPEQWSAITKGSYVFGKCPVSAPTEYNYTSA